MPTVKVNGIDMYYEVHGKGEPLVLIHGGCFDSTAWAAQLDAFSKRCRVIVFDNRGVGRTETTKPPYSTAMMAEDVAALMDHIGVESAHVLGISMGGLIAQELAIQHPKKIKSLILAATAARFSPICKARTKLLVRMLREGVDLELALRSSFLWVFSDRFFEDEGRVTAAVNGFMNNPYPQPFDGLEGQIAAILSHDTTDRLAVITSRTLVLCGTEDITIPLRFSKELAEGIRGSKLVLIEGGTHSFLFEMAEDFNKAVLDFLEDA